VNISYKFSSDLFWFNLFFFILFFIFIKYSITLYLDNCYKPSIISFNSRFRKSLLQIIILCIIILTISFLLFICKDISFNPSKFIVLWNLVFIVRDFFILDLNFAGVPVFLNPNGSKFSNLNFAVGPGGESSTTGESSTSESYTNRANTTEQEKLKNLLSLEKKPHLKIHQMFQVYLPLLLGKN